jgi:hypothetical protein
MLGHGYVHPEGSVYQILNTLAIFTWQDMMDLRAIPPLGIFPSVIKAIQMFFINIPAMIAMVGIHLGGAYSPLLFGPTPINLIPPNVPFVQMAIAPNPLPVNIVPNAAANHGPNWGQWYVEVDVHISI